jgi:hypothetical protein
MNRGGLVGELHDNGHGIVDARVEDSQLLPERVRRNLAGVFLGGTDDRLREQAGGKDKNADR